MMNPYGKYSLGSGSILLRPDRLFSPLDDPEIVQAHIASLTRDLKRAGISKRMLRNYEVLDVGTGRQAIAFYLLGAKKVQHYDLSSENVKKLEMFIEKNSLQHTLVTKHANLVRYPLPKDTFDFVYLHGVVQHFSNTAVGLLNCLESVKLGGKVWLYFYRSGSFVQFVISLIRDLINGRKEAKEYFLNAVVLYSDDVLPNYFVSNVMDDFFAPFIHLYTPKSYLSFLSACGFEVRASSKMGSIRKEVDHRTFHESVILVCRKVSKVSQQGKEKSLRLLSPSKSIPQLNPSMYSPADVEILETIKDFRTLKRILSKKNVPSSLTMNLAFRLHEFLLDAKKDIGKDNLHSRLRMILNNTRTLVEKGF